jgi:dTDP-glucose pyrophosphorylase
MEEFQKNKKGALVEIMVKEIDTIEDAIRSLNNSGRRICLVVDNQRKLVGTVSDGDIRRGLLNGKTLSTPCREVAQLNPLVVPAECSRAMAHQMMLVNKVQQIPEVGEDGVVLDLHTWEDLNSGADQDSIIVVMAGGQGIRLRPLTEDCPKPMLKVGDKPMLEHLIIRARNQGFKKIVLSVNYLGHMIEDYFQDGKEFGVQIEYLREKAPLGTAGALSLLPNKPASPLIVINGDVATEIKFDDLLEFHKRQKAKLTMAVRLHEWQHPYGVVTIDGSNIVGFEEKPVFQTRVNAGIYVLSPEALELLQANQPCDMPTLFERAHSRSLATIAYPTHEPWLDIGRQEDLKSANHNQSKENLL